MCKFKSGIILKNMVVLTPEGDESHANLLEKLNISDNHMNASKVFVKAELIPPEDNKAAPIEKWKYKVDQDITPDWYDKDQGRYENEMRESVAEYMKDRLQNIICGYEWTSIQDESYTYYFMNGKLCTSKFGETNNYNTSYIRKKLLASDLLTNLKEKFGDKLVPIDLDLTSIDGFKDYGSVKGDLIAIPNIQLLMKFGSQLPLIREWYWLATPNETPTRRSSTHIQCVSSGGRVGCDGCGWGDCGVRPFFILQS